MRERAPNSDARYPNGDGGRPSYSHIDVTGHVKDLGSVIFLCRREP